MPHIIQRSTFKDTLNDILHVLGKVQIGRIGIPKQIRGEIFETLSPRGVCSRIPHLRLFRRAHHGLFIAHTYAHIIPYLVTSGLPHAGADRGRSPSSGRGELRRRSEGYVDVLVKHLRDVRTRHPHLLRKPRLSLPQLLHPQKNSPKKGQPYVIYRSTHCSIVRIVIFRWRWKVEVDSGCLNFFL